MALPLLRPKDSQRRRDPTLHQIAPTLQNRPLSSDAHQIAEWLAADRSLLSSRCCIFLDLDGTLIEFHEDPAAIGADEELRHLLQSTANALGGALALISGRSSPRSIPCWRRSVCRSPASTGRSAVIRAARSIARAPMPARWTPFAPCS